MKSKLKSYQIGYFLSALTLLVSVSSLYELINLKDDAIAIRYYSSTLWIIASVSLFINSRRFRFNAQNSKKYFLHSCYLSLLIVLVGMVASLSYWNRIYGFNIEILSTQLIRHSLNSIPFLWCIQKIIKESQINQVDNL